MTCYWKNPNPNCIERSNTATAISLEQRCVISRNDATTANRAAAKNYVFECTTAGTTAAGLINFNVTPGSTTTDGTVVWTCREPDSWDNASLFLDYVATRLLPGEICYGLYTNAEITGTPNIVFNSSTATAPALLYSVTEDLTPTEGASCTSSGTTTLSINGSVYSYGVFFHCMAPGAVGASTLTMASNTSLSNFMTFEKGGLLLNGSQSASSWSIGVLSSTGTTVPSQVMLKDVQIRKGVTATAAIAVRCPLIIEGGKGPDAYAGLNGGGTDGFFACERGGSITIQGFDFSNMRPTVPLVRRNTLPSLVEIIDCKLPTSFTGGYVGGSQVMGPGARIVVYNTDPSKPYYEENSAGIIQDEQTIKMSGAALSIKMTTGPNSSYLFNPMQWQAKIGIDTVGSPITFTAEVLWDSTTDLTNQDFWIDAMFMADAAMTLATFTTTRKAVPVAAVALASSTVTWNTGAMANPRKQKVSITFTPQRAGVYALRANLARVSTTVYFNPPA